MYLDLNLATFKYIDGFRCYHLCLYFDWNWLFSCELLRNFGSVLGLKIAVTFASVLGLQVNTGLQPPTCWEPFVSGTMLRRPEPTKEWAQPTILSITGAGIWIWTRFGLRPCIIVCNIVFGLDVNLKNLNHFTGIWKRLKVTVWGPLPWSRYANTLSNHDKVSIYCALLPLSESKVSGLPVCKLGKLHP